MRVRLPIASQLPFDLLLPYLKPVDGGLTFVFSRRRGLR